MSYRFHIIISHTFIQTLHTYTDTYVRTCSITYIHRQWLFIARCVSTGINLPSILLGNRYPSQKAVPNDQERKTP